MTRSGSLVPVFVGLALLVAALGGAAFVGSRLLDDLRAGSGVIAYTTTTFGWNDGPVAERVVVSTVQLESGGSVLLTDVPNPPKPREEEFMDGAGSATVVRQGPAVHWSPDGSQLAFWVADEGSGAPSGLYVMGADGTGLRHVVDPAEVYEAWRPPNAVFAWSPDGRRIALIPMEIGDPWINRSQALYVVDVDDGDVTLAAAGASGSLSWSPDGSRIAFGRTIGSDFESRSAVVVVNSDGTGETVVLDAVGSARHFGAVSWSPNGSRIAFIRENIPDDAPWSLNLINADGTGLERIWAWESGCCIHGAFAGLVEWSPDGSAVAVRTDVLGRPLVQVVAANGSGALLAIDAFDADWSPDGKQLVYSARGSVIAGFNPLTIRSSIYVVNVDGTNRRWLADGDYPTWSLAKP